MRVKCLGLFLCGLGLGLGVGACGDDDGGAPTDASGEDGGPSPVDAGRDTGRPPMDAGVDAGPTSSIEGCDPFTTGDCSEGEKCAIVLDRSTDPEEASIVFGCVPTSTGTKVESIPCAMLGQDATPDDETDDIVTDDCAEGLFCWRASGQTIPRCHRLCGDDRVDCAAAEYCATLNATPRFGICNDADGCDPVFQRGCDDGRSCYLVRNTQDDYLGSCFQFSPPDGGTGAPGEPCRFINGCQPGSQCFPEFFPDGGISEERTCKSLCNAGAPVDAGAADAGMDAGTAGDGGMDAGVPTDGGPSLTGDCTGALTCVPIPLPDGGVAMVPTEPGSCQ